MTSTPQGILIPGGNSGIGLEAARRIVREGHHVILLGRDQTKGERAIAGLGAGPGTAEFHSVDLSTHDGVRAAAETIGSAHDRIDAILHSTGDLTMKEARTSDGLHAFFAVNYLSRYHLTMLLLSALRRARAPRVLMMTAKVASSTPIDRGRFPRFKPYRVTRDLKPIQAANHHLAAHLAATEPGLLAGVVNAGTVNTDITRSAPGVMRLGYTLLGSVLLDSVETAGANPAAAALRTAWASATYWDEPGDFTRRTPIEVDLRLATQIMAESAKLTNA